MRSCHMAVLFAATVAAGSVSASASMAAERADIDPPPAVAAAAAAAAGPDWIEVRGGQWPVPAALIADMAGKLQGAGSPSTRVDFSKYTIQYQGLNGDNGRHVRLFGMCDRAAIGQRDLSASFGVIFGGGKCYFEATYDPARGSFTAFEFHSPR